MKGDNKTGWKLCVQLTKETLKQETKASCMFFHETKPTCVILHAPSLRLSQTLSTKTAQSQTAYMQQKLNQSMHHCAFKLWLMMKHWIVWSSLKKEKYEPFWKIAAPLCEHAWTNFSSTWTKWSLTLFQPWQFVCHAVDLFNVIIKVLLLSCKWRKHQLESAQGLCLLHCAKSYRPFELFANENCNLKLQNELK